MVDPSDWNLALGTNSRAHKGLHSLSQQLSGYAQAGDLRIGRPIKGLAESKMIG
jgi:hypothetical protein